MAYFFILLGTILRLVPHPGNFVPIAALALFGGTYLNKKQAVIIPLAAMAISDFFIGFDSLTSRLTIYGCFAAAALIGMWIKNHKNVYTVVGGALASSVIFFLITNLPFIHPNSLYPYTLGGTIQSYINALPFFRNTVAGDLFYTAAFFGAYEAVRFYAYHRQSTSKV